MLAPNVAAGEESPDEAAIRERSIELLFSRRDLDDEREAHYIWLRDHGELLGSFGRSLLDTALDTMPSEVLQRFTEGRAFFKSKLPQRVLDNLCCLYAGLSLIVKLCGRLGLSWNEAFSFDREACVNHIEYAARKGNKRMHSNPMVAVAKDYFKLSNEAWDKIWAIIAQNCSENFGGDNPNDDLMKRLLTMNLDD